MIIKVIKDLFRILVLKSILNPFVYFVQHILEYNFRHFLTFPLAKF